MNLILECSKQVPYFTEMGAVLRALNITANDYDWYLSNIETNRPLPGLPDDDQWISGEHLHQLVSEHEIQFIWAVFSALPKGACPTVGTPPYADGNSSYWNKSGYKPQLDGALFEITCRDSSATILAGITAEMAANFSIAYPDAKPLTMTAR